MSLADWRIVVSRGLFLAAFGCGIIGLVVGISENEWRLGVTGWFTGGALVGVLALIAQLDGHFEFAKRQT